MKMRYGNCLIGALFLFWKKRKKNPKIKVKVRPGTIIPHFMIRDKKALYHYKLDKDVLPWPLCYLVFKGSFQRLKPEKEYLFEMNKQHKNNLILFISFLFGIVFAVLFQK